MPLPTDMDELKVAINCFWCNDPLDKNEKEHGVCRQCGAHVGDPCKYCGIPHDEVPPGPCKGKQE